MLQLRPTNADDDDDSNGGGDGDGDDDDEIILATLGWASRNGRAGGLCHFLGRLATTTLMLISRPGNSVMLRCQTEINKMFVECCRWHARVRAAPSWKCIC